MSAKLARNVVFLAQLLRRRDQTWRLRVLSSEFHAFNCDKIEAALGL